MRFFHLADLHFGKAIHGVSLLENGDQTAWTERFLALAQELRPDAAVIAGDVYDRSSPSGEAVTLLSRLVTGLARLSIPVMMTAGNHDSGQRLSFAGELLAREQVHIAGTADKTLQRVTLHDDYGGVTFWLLPYVFPALIGHILADETIRDYDTAVRRLLACQDVDFTQRNVIVAHQNVTAAGAEALRGGSESTVGGVGQIDYTAFDGFDYVALGHIHAAGAVGRSAVRYAGSPLCYHFDETRQAAKGPVLVELGVKGAPPRIQTLAIPPLHPMREICGPFEEVRQAELSGGGRGEYLRLVLTDRPMTPETADFFHRLAESRGSILMECVSAFRRFADGAQTARTQDVRDKAPEERFADFFTERSGGETPSSQDLALLHHAGELLRSNGVEAKRHVADTALGEALVRFLLKQEEVTA